MDEQQQKQWLLEHANEVLKRVGIAPGQVVVDFGCGRGGYALAASRLVGEEGRVYAVDRDLEVLEELRGQLPDDMSNLIMVHVKNITLRLDASSVEWILLFDVLHMVEESDLLLHELARVLKPDGQLCVYPMHLSVETLTDDMQRAGFALAQEHYQGQILVFSPQADA